MDKISWQPRSFDGDGDVRARLRALDWQASPLGPPVHWPQELLTTVNLILSSKFPMFVAWGPELGFLYNDEYAAIMGDKHPAGLGQPFRTVWPEIWSDILPIIDAAMAGRASYFEDLPLLIDRRGYPEPAWFTFSYSPMEDRAGTVAGLYCTVVETTPSVVARQAQAFQLHLADLLRDLASADAVVAAASESLGRQLGVTRVQYCEVDDERGVFSVRGGWMQGAAASIEGQIRRLDDFGPEVVALLRAGEPMVVNDVARDPRTSAFSEAYAALGIGTNLALSLIKSGRMTAILSVHDAQPRQWTTAEVQMARDMAERTWSAMENASTQAELREANQRKDEFLAMLAHELRNPLAPISAAAELMEKSVLDGPALRRTSAIISRQVRHMTGLVDDLLDVSRVTRGQVKIEPSPQDMKAVVASAVEQVKPMIEARRHQLALTLPPEPVEVLGDANRLVQILTNLLNNAAKYTADGGQLRLSMEADLGQVLVRVSDNGIGIAPDMQTRVFELFAQAERTSDRSQGGLGLGLALVRSLVELHGGRVRCLSDGANRGSTFEVRLPRHRAIKQSVQATAAPPVAGGPENIMVVDDNEDAAVMLAMLLEASGHTVLVAHRPTDAIALAAQHAPTVCILDIGLPDMDGYQLAEHLRAMPETAHAMLIAVTGYGQQNDRTRALEAGFDQHLVKPVEAERLLALIAQGRALSVP
ncbi:ATP-binding protein [Massilia sp. CF038]|uniref:hybrid sensor histidine kinase/response regulator n=1 Tax=Massilia sp. CF038 TaxID=1881045 RepID=UPI001E30C9D8|nr:ATP-binding protein [Massilia sp. CF038]